jgi:hypothetical protein
VHNKANVRFRRLAGIGMAQSWRYPLPRFGVPSEISRPREVEFISDAGRYRCSHHPSPAPATARQRQADGKARTNGIGEVREHAADDVAELAFHANEGNIRDGDDQREHS